MKWIALTVLLAVMQAAPPVQPKAHDNSAQTTANVKGKSEPSQAQSPPVPAPGKADSNGTAESDSGKQHSKDTDHSVIVRELPAVTIASPRRDWADWGVWVFNLLLVAVGFLQVCLLLWTLRQIRGQRKLMGNQWRTMSKQLTEMAAQTALLDKYVAETKTIASATIVSANAAKISADIAAGVSIPKLVIHEFAARNAGAAALPAMLQLPNIKLVINNYGQTPALLRSWSILFTCEELPTIPVYSGQPGCGIVLTNEVIQPNEPYTLTVVHHWNRQEFSLDEVEAIIDNRKTLNAYGYVCYSDIFGNPLQRFKFFATALNLSDTWIDWRTELAPDAYVGTDRFPYKKSGDQPHKAD